MLDLGHVFEAHLLHSLQRVLAHQLGEGGEGRVLERPCDVKNGEVSDGGDRPGEKPRVRAVGPVGRGSASASPERPPQVSLSAFADTRVMMENTGRATHKGNMGIHDRSTNSFL